MMCGIAGLVVPGATGTDVQGNYSDWDEGADSCRVKDVFSQKEVDTVDGL